MYKIGVDMTTVSRIEKSSEKPNFLAHVFTQRELDAFYHRDKPKFASLAANFAAKEAFSKALGTGIRAFGFNDVEMLRMVGTGIAMGNGCEEAKRAAKFIAPDVEEDGLAWAVDRILQG